MNLERSSQLYIIIVSVYWTQHLGGKYLQFEILVLGLHVEHPVLVRVVPQFAKLGRSVFGRIGPLTFVMIGCLCLSEYGWVLLE